MINRDSNSFISSTRFYSTGPFDWPDVKIPLFKMLKTLITMARSRSSVDA
jgi:hypothetical protein